MNKEVDSNHYLSSEFEFGIFFRENYHTACLVALKYVKDNQLAEDLVQDVFVTLWEKRSTFRAQINLRNYFLTAVRNHAINLILRNKSVTTSLSELFIDLPEEENSNFYSKEELAVRVFKAIQELPQGCQTIFKLAYEQNFTYQEIADTLQISKNTVKTQMGIAYKQLREKLNNLIFNLLSIFLKK
jgi:RNA polymerase sigma-70 factor (ECF subfamily)